MMATLTEGPLTVVEAVVEVAGFSDAFRAAGLAAVMGRTCWNQRTIIETSKI